MILNENTVTEFKRDYTTDINKTVVAFANTNGGTLYIGVSDNGEIYGVADIDAVLLRLGNAIRDSIKPDVTLFVEYEREIMNGKPIIKVSVQKGVSCPYYLSNKGIRPEGVYVRQDASSVPASNTVILRMIKETDGESYEDIRSLNQEMTFIKTENEFETQKIQFGVNQQKKLGMMNTDGIYTNLGLLLSDQCVHTIKTAMFEGTDKIFFKDRREFTGSLLKQLGDVYEFINLYNRNRSEIEGLRRIDKRDYPPEAVRETLINAIIHRDYSFSDSTLISIFDDRMEFVSIGGLVRGISYNDIMLGISIARNKKLADVFYRLSLIEAYGTGMPKIIRSYNGYPVKPLVEVTDNAFKITLPNINEALQKNVLDENELLTLELFKNQDCIARKDVEAALGVSQSMAGRVLGRLAEKNEIRSVGNGKKTRYTRIKY